MTTEIVDYEALLAGMAKATTATERPASSTIGTQAGVLTYNGDAVPGNVLECIIIASTHANLYYEGKFDRNNPSNPVCYAYSEDGENMAPHPTSSKPQAESCDACPHNKWHSDPEGGKGKACKNSRCLALIPAGTTPDEVPRAEVATLALPVMSVKAWGSYVHEVAALFNRPPLGVVTAIGTKPDPKSQFRITFTNKGPVEKEMLKPLIDKIPLVKDVLERTYDPNEEQGEEEVKTNKSKKH